MREILHKTVNGNKYTLKLETRSLNKIEEYTKHDKRWEILGDYPCRREIYDCESRLNSIPVTFQEVRQIETRCKVYYRCDGQKFDSDIQLIKFLANKNNI